MKLPLPVSPSKTDSLGSDEEDELLDVNGKYMEVHPMEPGSQHHPLYQKRSLFISQILLMLVHLQRKTVELK